MGVRAYHNQSIIEMIKEASPSVELLYWVDRSQMIQEDEWSGSPQDLTSELATKPAAGAAKPRTVQIPENPIIRWAAATRTVWVPPRQGTIPQEVQ